MNESPTAIDRLPTTHRGWSDLFAATGVRPSKGLGQHFLIERGIVHRIVRTSGIVAGDRVLEIGPGFGILTQALLSAGADLTAIELDQRLAAHLRRAYADVAGFVLTEGDALSIDIDVASPYRVVANLPYSIGTAILMRLLELPEPPSSLTVMIQREVAERLSAEPPEMSVLGVAAQLLARPRIAFHVAPSVFLPPPRVESSVVVFTSLGDSRLPMVERADFFAMVNAGFRHKRKQVANSLAMDLGLAKAEVIDLLARAEIEPSRRAETLSVDEWLTLHRHRRNPS